MSSLILFFLALFPVTATSIYVFLFFARIEEPRNKTPKQSVQ